MNLTQLRAFHAVVQHGTFSAAAIALNVSQPAITQHIRTLEEAIGGRLFHRRSSGVELTPDGDDLLPHVQQIMRGLEDVAARLQCGRTLRTGHLMVGLCSPQVALPLIRRFQRQHPGIQLETRLSNSADLLDLVVRYRVDVASVTLSAPRPDLVCHRLVAQEVLVVVPAGHPWAARQTLDVAELDGQDFILRESGSMTRQVFERALANSAVEIRRSLVLSSREAVKEAVANGLGLGIVFNQELGQDPRIAGLRITGAEVRADEYLVAHPEIAHLGSVREFIACSAAMTSQL